MPLVFDWTSSVTGSDPRRNPRRSGNSRQAEDRSQPDLTIGLINNMKDGALETTERQFLSLLADASEDRLVKLRFYQLPGIPRKNSIAHHVEESYSDINTLWNTSLDGLIVTGREPSNARLQDEPYWKDFVRLLDWAHDHTTSTIWSCLAAHAAVLHMDGISRTRNNWKHSGLFGCETLSRHPIIEAVPPRFLMPHSRWNGLEEKQLLQRGYDVLTVSPRVGVDTFIKQHQSLFIFFQGHPEYESHTLLLEYRRDVARYLRRQAAVYPSIPRSYFDDETVAALCEIQHAAQRYPREILLHELSAVFENVAITHAWRQTAVSLYKNWLHHLAVAKGLPPLRTPSNSLSHDVPQRKHIANARESDSHPMSIPVHSTQ